MEIFNSPILMDLSLFCVFISYSADTLIRFFGGRFSLSGRYLVDKSKTSQRIIGNTMVRVKRKIETLTRLNQTDTSDSARNGENGRQRDHSQRREPPQGSSGHEEDAARQKLFSSPQPLEAVTGMKEYFLHYPRPVTVGHLLAKVGSDMGFILVMKPSLDRKVQIFCPGPVSRSEALDTLAVALDAVGLRIVFVSGRLAKIVEKLPTAFRI